MANMAAMLNPTRAQLGAANVPAVHLDVTQVVDPREAPVQSPTAPDQESAQPRWRPIARITLPPAGAPTLVDQAATLDRHEISGVEGSHQPDPRAVFNGVGPNAGYQVTTPGVISPDATANIRVVDPHFVEPPISDRPRAGWTSEDGTREPTGMPHWLYTRPFDKLMSSSLRGNKVVQSDPIARRPYYAAQPVAGAVPSPMGGGAAYGMHAFGRFSQPNSQRVLPDPWDSDVLNLGAPQTPSNPDPSAVASSAARAGGWRL